MGQRFRKSRNGDHLICPFQCDLCHFRNLQKRDPEEGDSRDQLLLLYLRRANIDAFWAREPGTVSGNLREARRVQRLSQTLGIVDPYQMARGPFPVKDLWGVGCAVIFLGRSLDAGKNDATIQFDMARRVRAHFSSHAHTTPGGISFGMKSSDKVMSSPTSSLWFQRFAEGSHKRMGDLHRPDWAVTVDERLGCLNILETAWSEATDDMERVSIAWLAVGLVVGFAAALRGEEIGKLHLGSTVEVFVQGLEHPIPHVACALEGRFKGELGERAHYLAMAPVTHSGIRILQWVWRLLVMLQKLGLSSGALVGDEKGIAWRVKGSGPSMAQVTPATPMCTA